MSATTVGASTAPARAAATQLRTDPAYQAFTLLRIGFTVAPILFGLDKFANVMVDWSVYLAPWINDILPGSADDAMYVDRRHRDRRRPLRRPAPALRRAPRRRLARRHHLQPAHLLGLLRHRPARLRPHARRADAVAAVDDLRPLGVAAARRSVESTRFARRAWAGGGRVPSPDTASDSASSV